MRPGDREPVRVQWDPERDLHFAPLAHRSLRIGLSGEAVARYCDQWIREIRDVTDLARECHAQLREQGPDAAVKLLPAERVYPVPPQIAARIGMESSHMDSDQ